MTTQLDRLLRDLEEAAGAEVGYRIRPETAAYLARILRAGQGLVEAQTVISEWGAIEDALYAYDEAVKGRDGDD